MIIIVTLTCKTCGHQRTYDMFSWRDQIAMFKAVMTLFTPICDHAGTRFEKT